MIRIYLVRPLVERSRTNTYGWVIRCGLQSLTCLRADTRRQTPCDAALNLHETIVSTDMPVCITYFVHGTSTDNEAGLSSGWNNPPLSALGRKQAEELKTILDSPAPLPEGSSLARTNFSLKFARARVRGGSRGNDKNPKFDAVFSSDLERAAETAKIVFGDAVLLEVRLRECNYGNLNGKSTAIVEPLQEHTSERFPEGESYEDVKKRVADFLGFLKREYDGKHVALVAHKAPQLVLDVLLRGKTWEQAFAEDWRKTGSWQAGWKYEVR